MKNLVELKKAADDKYAEYREAVRQYDERKATENGSPVINAYKNQYVHFVDSDYSDMYVYVKNISVINNVVYISGPFIHIGHDCYTYGRDEDMPDISIDSFDENTGLSEKLEIISEGDFKKAIELLTDKFNAIKEGIL